MEILRQKKKKGYDNIQSGAPAGIKILVGIVSGLFILVVVGAIGYFIRHHLNYSRRGSTITHGSTPASPAAPESGAVGGAGSPTGPPAPPEPEVGLGAASYDGGSTRTPPSSPRSSASDSLETVDLSGAGDSEDSVYSSRGATDVVPGYTDNTPDDFLEATRNPKGTSGDDLAYSHGDSVYEENSMSTTSIVSGSETLTQTESQSVADVSPEARQAEKIRAEDFTQSDEFKADRVLSVEKNTTEPLVARKRGALKRRFHKRPIVVEEKNDNVQPEKEDQLDPPTPPVRGKNDLKRRGRATRTTSPVEEQKKVKVPGRVARSFNLP